MRSTWRRTSGRLVGGKGRDSSPSRRHIEQSTISWQRSGVHGSGYDARLMPRVESVRIRHKSRLWGGYGGLQDVVVMTKIVRGDPGPDVYWIDRWGRLRQLGGGGAECRLRGRVGAIPSWIPAGPVPLWPPRRREDSMEDRQGPRSHDLPGRYSRGRMRWESTGRGRFAQTVTAGLTWGPGHHGERRAPNRDQHRPGSLGLA
jgi:hypothetical protein